MANYPQCQGRRRDGRPCTSPLVGADGYCFAHSPTRAAERQAAQQRGGQHRASVVRLRGLCPPKLVQVYEQLEAALGEVHAGTLPPTQAMAMAALARAMVAVLQAGELEERLRRVEERTG
jgi:hypothetical protein